jgi:hypothetical protein
MTDRLIMEVTRDGWTDGLQMSISQLDENGAGHGYRIAGPKFNGSGEVLLKRELDERDAAEIRAYLDAVFPQIPEGTVTEWGCRDNMKPPIVHDCQSESDARRRAGLGWGGTAVSRQVTPWTEAPEPAEDKNDDRQA